MSYVSVSEKITAAITAAIEEDNSTLDEIFAALSVQKEIWNVKLAKALLTPPVRDKAE